MSLRKETIAAICTPSGDGGVAMIRISGECALQVANALFSKDVLKLASHQMVYGRFCDVDKKTLDQGLLVVMKAPNSYTGEEVVEIFCHGGRLITQKVLERTFEAGAKPAQPGEFTQRAYLNKKMDLAQAEAVQLLISAQNEYALKMAQSQLEGELSKSIRAMQEKLVEQAAILEAWVDFPEEGIEFCSLEDIIAALNICLNQMATLIHTFRDGQALKEGFSICLLGKPNVGKSSLMNRLLKKDRAIVTDIAGTTRDLLEEAFFIQGMKYRLIDTAGIRKTDQIVEEIGIERALKASKNADLTLLVLDASTPFSSEDQKLLKSVGNHLVVWNKIDLKKEPLEPQLLDAIEISAKTGRGFESLCAQILEKTLPKAACQDQIFLTEARHKKSLQEAYDHLKKVIDGLESGQSAEWLSYDLKSSLRSLSEIMGMDITESILSNIFAKFCIGK